MMRSSKSRPQHRLQSTNFIEKLRLVTVCLPPRPLETLSKFIHPSSQILDNSRSLFGDPNVDFTLPDSLLQLSMQIPNHSQHLSKRQLCRQLGGCTSCHPVLVLRMKASQLSTESDECRIVCLSFLGEAVGKGVGGELLSVSSLPFLKGLLEVDDARLLLSDDPPQRGDQLLVWGGLLRVKSRLPALLHRCQEYYKYVKGKERVKGKISTFSSLSPLSFPSPPSLPPFKQSFTFKQQFKSHSMQSKPGPLALLQKKTIQSEEIKQIVLLLNEPPFQENISLVGLDELSTFDLGDLVFKIFKYLNPDLNINARQTQPQEIIFQVTEFLRILSYDCEFTPEWEAGLLNGDRKIIYPIYYFLLKNQQALKKRAYLAKFLVPLDIPADYVGDPELKKLNEQMKELQAEFQIVHEEYEGIESSSLNPTELKKQLTKLEQEKEQLTTKITSMKSKHGAKPEMAAMLIPTSQLRKEQEEEVRITEKIHSYRSQLESAENQLLSLEQSLTDAKKSLSPNNSPEQMLHAVKNEVRKNREIVKERMTVEYNERLKKLQQTEKMLAEPPITQNELMMLENTMTALRRAVTQMQERLSKETSKDDKLAIYKGQAALVTKKKEQTQEALKRQEEDMSRLQNEIRKKEQQINKIKGAGFKKNKLEDYISELKQKKAKYAKCKAEIEEIKWQSSNLERTYQLLKQQKERYEKLYGLVDGQRVASDVNIENASMDQLNRQIEKLLDQIKRKKGELAPKLEQKKNVLSEFQKIQNEYKSKKVSFLGTTGKIQDDTKEIEQKVNKLRGQVESMDTKLQINKLKNELIDLKMVRLSEQGDNLKGNGKGCCGNKSYQQYVKVKVAQGDKEIISLTAERQRVAERHMPSMEQKRMFNDLKKLLLIKLQAGQGGSIDHFQNKGERLSNNVNVLKL